MEPKKSVLLRIDRKLWNDLNEWSKDELRSINGQIEWILREAVKKRKGNSGGNSSSESQKGKNI